MEHMFLFPRPTQTESRKPQVLHGRIYYPDSDVEWGAQKSKVLRRPRGMTMTDLPDHSSKDLRLPPKSIFTEVQQQCEHV